MSKLVVLLIAGAFASVLSVGGLMFLDWWNSSEEDFLSIDLPFRQLSDFKKEKGGDCGSYLFGNLDFGEEGKAKTGTDPKIDANYFGEGSKEKSCLVVNWERTAEFKNENDRWNGNFRWVWSFVKGSKGFISFATTKLSSTPKTLDLEGGIWFFKREKGKWKVDKSKELDSSKNITSTNWDKAFPQPGEVLKKAKDKANWGFLSKATDLDKVCKAGEEESCTKKEDKLHFFKGLWTWSKTEKNESSGSLAKWCKNFENYFSNMYSTAEIDLKSSLEPLSGIWKNVALIHS